MEAAGPDFEAAELDFEAPGPDFEAPGPDFKPGPLTGSQMGSLTVILGSSGNRFLCLPRAWGGPGTGRPRGAQGALEDVPPDLGNVPPNLGDVPPDWFYEAYGSVNSVIVNLLKIRSSYHLALRPGSTEQGSNQMREGASKYAL